MLTDAELAGMRDTSTSALPDDVVFTRAATGGVLDPVTGVWTPNPPTVIYDGKGRVRPPTATETEVIFGDTLVSQQRYIVTIPWDAGDVRVDDMAVVAVGSDPHIGTRSFRVTAVSGGSWLIDRRIGVEVSEP